MLRALKDFFCGPADSFAPPPPPPLPKTAAEMVSEIEDRRDIALARDAADHAVTLERARHRVAWDLLEAEGAVAEAEARLARLRTIAKRLGIDVGLQFPELHDA